jgi:hypothetical protein
VAHINAAGLCGETHGSRWAHQGRGGANERCRGAEARYSDEVTSAEQWAWPIFLTQRERGGTISVGEGEGEGEGSEDGFLMAAWNIVSVCERYEAWAARLDARHLTSRCSPRELSLKSCFFLLIPPDNTCATVHFQGTPRPESRHPSSFS